MFRGAIQKTKLACFLGHSVDKSLRFLKPTSVSLS